MKTLKKILLISLIIIVVIVTGLVILLKILSAKPAVSNNYSSKVVATGILEQKYTGNGSSKVGYIEYESDDENIRKIEIWYPKEIENGIDKYPVVIMANGTGVPASKYQAIFNHLASWGFITLMNDQEAKKVFWEDSAELISNVSNWMDVIMENFGIGE